MFRNLDNFHKTDVNRSCGLEMWSVRGSLCGLVCGSVRWFGTWFGTTFVMSHRLLTENEFVKRKLEHLQYRVKQHIM